MGARLVHIEGGRRLSVTPLGDADVLVGRDPAACAVVIESARVSRQHLLVRRSSEGWIAADLGSANGTTLNGELLVAPALLASGDVLELAETARFAFEITEVADEGTQVLEHLALGDAFDEGEETDDEGSGGRVFVLASVAVLAVLASVLVWRLAFRGPDPVDAEATQIATEGLQAAERREWPLAKKRLKAAARVLYSNGKLDDVPREQVMQVAMERLGQLVGDELDREVDLPDVYHNAIDASVFEEAVAPEPVPEARSGTRPKAACRLDQVPPEQIRDCIHERVGLFLVALRQSPDGVPPWFYEEVGQRIRAEHDFFERSLQRGERHVPMMKLELRRAKMPEDLHYLSMIESGYQTDIGSHAGAVGLWQFMPGTARRFGLRVDDRVDERTDPRRSTQEAARYLNQLALEFGADDLLLVLAGYNKGENGVRAALRQMSDPFEDRSYWKLVENDRLPKETAEYVARFIAAGISGEGGLPTEETLASAGF